MPKSRKPFILLDKHNAQIGHGVAYHQGNVQVYMKPDYAALQMHLVDVLFIAGVCCFQWADTPIGGTP